MHQEFTDKIYSWTKDTLEKLLPEEVTAFIISWPAYLAALKKVDPARFCNLPFDAFKRNISMTDVYAHPAADIYPHAVVVYAISSSFASLSQSQRKIKFEDIQDEVRSNLIYWDFTDEVKEKVVDHISHLLEIEFSGRERIRPLKGNEYQVIENGKKRLCTEGEAQKYRERKDSFDIFADDDLGKVYIGSEKSKYELFTGETDWYLTLIFLLEKMGTYCTHDELFERGTVNPTDSRKHAGSSISQLVYQRIMHIKDLLKKGLDAQKVDNWLSTKTKKRVMISTVFKTCLVKRNK